MISPQRRAGVAERCRERDSPRRRREHRRFIFWVLVFPFSFFSVPCVPLRWESPLPLQQLSRIVIAGTAPLWQNMGKRREKVAIAMNTQETISEANEFKIVQSYFGYAVPGAILTAAAAAVCFYINFILAGLMFSAFFVGIIDVMFRKIITIADPSAKTVTVTDVSPWRGPRRTTYHPGDVTNVEVGVKATYSWHVGLWWRIKRQYKIMLMPKGGCKVKLKILWGKEKAYALRDQLAAVLGLDTHGPSS